uniref:Putative acyl-coa-binding protein n=1 Tax=Phlebotomus kandelakii TaxID=1109342 RepID=A0A6B2E5A8_9DIPT
MGLKEDFDKAAEDVKKLKASPSNEDLLELYALFKQASVGDCNTSKPGMLDFKGKAKWESWNGKKGLATDDAMKQYVELVARLQQEIGLA